MKKTQNRPPFISEAVKNLDKNEPLPVYYFYGEDSFLVDEAVKKILNKLEHYEISEFDKETFYGSNSKLIDVLDVASAFPFSSQKKIIIFKEFEKVRDKKNLVSYLKSPAEFTTLILIHDGEIRDFSSALYKSLLNNGFIYSAKELKGKYLINWIVDYCLSNGKSINEENAQAIVDLIGDSKSLIDGQLGKIFTYISNKTTIELEDILNVSSELREFNIFNLEDAIAKKDRKNTFRIAYSLLGQGKDQTYIISMLTRYFTILTRVKELAEKKVPPREAAASLGVFERFYNNYVNARKIYSETDLYRISRALYTADLLTKTTSMDEKSVITVLLTEILLKHN